MSTDNPARPATDLDQRAAAGVAGGSPVPSWFRFFRSELRLVFSGPLAQLRGGDANRVLVRTPQPDLAVKVLTELGLTELRQDGQQVSADLGAMQPELICERLVLAGVPVAGLETPRRSLEDEFVELTGEGFNVDG